jgi:two-component system NarL family response regulator
MSPRGGAPERRVTVLVADHHREIRSGLVALIERQEGYRVVGEAGSGSDAVRLYLNLRPDVVLLDLDLPVLDGWETAAEILRHDREARILALSLFGDEDPSLLAAKGIRGLLMKDAAERDVADAIRAVHAGLRRFGTGVADTLASRADYEALSPQEVEVLREIARGKSNKEVAGDLGLTESTVKSHVNSILSKLGAGDRTGAVTLAIQRGLIHL